MLQKILIGIAALGVVLAVRTAVAGREVPPIPAPFAEAPRTPYVSTVAGAGLIEASSENVAVAAPVSGIIVRVEVRAGEDVAAGAPLFRLDDRSLRAEADSARAAILAAESGLARLRALPRPESLPPLRARSARPRRSSRTSARSSSGSRS